MYDSPSSTYVSERDNQFMTSVYIWMSLALLISGLVAYHVANSPSIRVSLFSNRLNFYVLIGAELALVIFLSRAVYRMSLGLAMISFILYSLLNGLTLSFIFLVYTSQSISATFFITAGTFGIMSLYGYVTKKDLSGFGNIALMALIGVLITSVVNLFIQSYGLYRIISYIGVLIFVVLTAYDTQKIKQIATNAHSFDDNQVKKMHILGALILYLDFINLFLYLIRILGKKR